MRIRSLLAAASLLALVAVAAPAALADPTHAKNSFTFPATCDGKTVTLVINSANGQGSGAQNQNTAPFAPAHVVGTNQIFHPTKFDLTFSFTFGATTNSFTDTNTMANAKTPVTCSIATTQNGPQGSFSLSGTVWGFFT